MSETNIIACPDMFLTYLLFRTKLWWYINYPNNKILYFSAKPSIKSSRSKEYICYHNFCM